MFCLLAYSIYKQILRQQNFEQSWLQIKNAFNSAAGWKLLLVMVLMLFNWGIEARKWQVVMRTTQRISFAISFKAIFTGTTLAFFTPNRIGEYLGRMLYIPQSARIQSVSLTIVSSIAQLMVTLAAGITGLVFIKFFIAQNTAASSAILLWLNIVLYVSVLAALILTVFYFRLSWLVRWIEKIPFFEKYTAHFKVLDAFNATILLRLLSLSVARYTVFIAQYYLLFQVFGVAIDAWQTFWTISVVFLILAMAPTIAIFTDLGIRVKASMELVQLFSANTTGILAASLSVWIINLVIPALIGSLLILGVKIFRER